jgi:hypothetical protein
MISRSSPQRPAAKVLRCYVRNLAIVVLDRLPDMSGFEVLEQIGQDASLSDVPSGGVYR